jgi:hypothetical protein
MAAAIGTLLDDPERRLSIGEAGREYVRTAHRADKYATGLLDFLAEVDAYHPYRRMVESIAEGMRHCATPVGSPLAIRWAAQVSAMLAGPSAAAD